MKEDRASAAEGEVLVVQTVEGRKEVQGASNASDVAQKA